MKRNLRVAFLCVAAAGSRLAGEEPAPPAPETPPVSAPETPAVPEAPALATKITAVTLYSDQVLVVRKGAVDLPAGRSRWEVAGLPAALRDESARARILTGGASLANLEVLTRNKTLFKKKEAEEAEKTLKEIQARHKGVSDALAALAQEAAVLKGFEVGKRPEGEKAKPEPAPIDVASWQAALQFIEASLGDNQKRARGLLAELDGVEEEMAVAAAHAEKLSSAKVEASKSVVLELEAAAAGRVELEVAYLVPGPGWWPRYDIRASVEAGKVEMVSHALVRQETGEDWDGVELTFSAAEPARAAALPELLAWHIGEAVGGAQPGSQTVFKDGMDLTQQALSKVEAFAARMPGTEFAKPSSVAPPAQQQLADQEVRRLNSERVRQQVAQQAKEGKVPFAGKAARTRGVLDNIAQLRASNEAALQKGDYNAVVEGNRALAGEIQNLDKRHQAFFFDDLAACSDNIARGERLIKSARLADGIVPPVRSSRGYDYKYRALRPETIPSDGAFNKVVIGVEEFPAELVYETAPELLEVAFLTTRIKNQRRQPYLDGPASVFLGSDFVGDGRVPTTARGEELSVNLGADESVQVKRHAERKRETTGFFTSYHKYRTEVEVAIRNQKARPVRIRVLDRVPFSEDRSVKVARGAIAPAPSGEERKGLLRWDLRLEPGREGKVSFAYTVELPADKQLVTTADESVRW